MKNSVHVILQTLDYCLFKKNSEILHSEANTVIAIGKTRGDKGCFFL